MGFGMEQQLAQGTALVMITPNVLIAFWRTASAIACSLRTAGLLGLATLLATWPAARLAVLLDSQVLMLCFAVFLVGLALFLPRRAGGAGQPAPAGTSAGCRGSASSAVSSPGCSASAPASSRRRC